MDKPAKNNDTQNLSLAAIRKVGAHKTPIVSNQYITSEMLFAGAKELVIEHAGGEYRLRQTNQGKLILTK